MITAGIDMGSRTVKVVFLEELKVDGAPAAALGRQGQAHHVPGGPRSRSGRRQGLRGRAERRRLIARAPVTKVVATGAGRKQVKFAADVTEVGAGARGAVFMCPTAKTVVDVGAEEGRGVKANAEGKVVDFAGNEKCAAGAGAFAESMSRALQLSLKEFGEASLRSDKTIPMNAQCTVFAESEVVSLIHSATPKEDIAKAVLDAVASRVCAMVRRVGIEDEVVLIGGMVHNPGFVQSLKGALGVDKVHLPDMPEYVSALGAALIAAEGNA
jgi:benzoyl-CoA reductase subunit D